MHDSSRQSFEAFLDVYIKNASGAQIAALEVGSRDVNGSVLDQTRVDIDWKSVDIAPGLGVTHVLADPYFYPFNDNTFNLVASSSVMEHMEFFWLAFLEMVRVCKEGGYIFINAPSNGSIHRFPIDAWRLYPDAGLVLQNWSIRNGLPIEVREALMLNRTNSGRWVDSCFVFQKIGLNSTARNSTSTSLKSHLLDSIYLDSLDLDNRTEWLAHPDQILIDKLRKVIRTASKVLRNIK
jgi:SAM-dependent methyltransferase